MLAPAVRCGPCSSGALQCCSWVGSHWCPLRPHPCKQGGHACMVAAAVAAPPMRPAHRAALPLVAALPLCVARWRRSKRRSSKRRGQHSRRPPMHRHPRPHPDASSRPSTTPQPCTFFFRTCHRAARSQPPTHRCPRQSERLRRRTPLMACPKLASAPCEAAAGPAATHPPTLGSCGWRAPPHTSTTSHGVPADSIGIIITLLCLIRAPIARPALPALPCPPRPPVAHAFSMTASKGRQMSERGHAPHYTSC